MHFSEIQDLIYSFDNFESVAPQYNFFRVKKWQYHQNQIEHLKKDMNGSYVKMANGDNKK